MHLLNNAFFHYCYGSAFQLETLKKVIKKTVSSFVLSTPTYFFLYTWLPVWHQKYFLVQSIHNESNWITLCYSLSLASSDDKTILLPRYTSSMIPLILLRWTAEKQMQWRRRGKKTEKTSGQTDNCAAETFILSTSLHGRQTWIIF